MVCTGGERKARKTTTKEKTNKKRCLSSIAINECIGGESVLEVRYKERERGQGKCVRI